MSDLMTTKEASEYLKLSYMTLYKLAQQGDIPAYKLGGHWRFNKKVLDEWFANKSQVIEKNVSQDTSQGTQAKDHLIAELLELRQHIDNLAAADKERTPSEESLKLSEEKLRNFMESSNDLFLIVDAKLNIVEINKAATKYLPSGMTRKNAIGKSILDLLPSIKTSGRYKRYIDVLKTGNPLEIDDAIVDHGTGQSHMAIKVFKLGNGLGIIMTDVTELRLFEALKDSEILSSNLLDNAPNPILVYESDTAIRYANRAFEDLTGFALKEIEGKKIPYPWWQKNTMDTILATFKDPSFYDTKKLELQFTKKNGDAFWIEMNTKAIMKDSNVSYYISNWSDITARKNAEAALRESEKKFRTLVEQSLQGIMIIQDGRIIFANNAMAQAVGYSVEQLLALSPEEISEFIHPDDREFVLSRMQKRLEGKAIPVRYEFRLIDRDGTIHWVDMNSNLIEYSGKPAIQLAMADITERKQAEQALMQEKNISEAIINSLPGVFYLFDEKGNFLRWNKNLETETEYSAEDLGQMSPLNLFKEKEKPIIKKKIKEVFKEGSSAVEIHAVSKSGREVPYYLTGSKIKMDNKEYLVGVGIDISKLKQTEDALRESENRLKTFIDNAQDAIAIVDTDGTLKEVNKKSEELTGYKKEELVGMNILKLSMIDNKYLPQIMDGFEYSNKGKPGGPVQIELIKKDGSHIIVEATGFPAVHEGKAEIFTIVRDITNIRKR